MATLALQSVRVERISEGVATIVQGQEVFLFSSVDTFHANNVIASKHKE
jgi:hypothetical protein